MSGRSAQCPRTCHLSLTLFAGRKGCPVGNTVCDFDCNNHDDLSVILQTASQNGAVPEEDVHAFVVGLKLFREVAMKNWTAEPFATLWPHLQTFMKSTKTPPESSAR